MAISVDSCVVALLGRDDGARRQLRHALEELGAAVAFEGEPGNASGSGLLGVAPNVVIVNLEEGADDDLDHLQAVFDAPDINVVFNDADVSRALEGWDLARWARHLAAKVLGSEDTMPPLPEGAQPLLVPEVFAPTPGPVPTPAQLAPEQNMDSFLDEALGLVDEVPVDALPEVVEAAIAVEELVAIEPEAAAEALDIDFSSLDDAMEAADAPAPVRLASTPEPVESESLDTLMVEDLSDDIARALDTTADDVVTVQTPAPVVEAVAEFGWDFDEPAENLSFDAVASVDDIAETAVSMPAADVSLDGIEVEADFSWDAPVIEPQEAESTALDTTDWSLEDSADVQADESALLDDDVAAMAAQLEALEASVPAVEQEAGLDFSDWDAPAPAVDSQPEVPVAATLEQPAAAASAAAFGDLSLAPMDDEEAPAPAEPAPAAVKSSFNFSGLDGLSLEPLEDQESAEAAPQIAATPDAHALQSSALDAAALDTSAPDVDPLLVAMGLVEAPSADETPGLRIDQPAPGTGGIEHVVVLGASIGGPDALRTFLGELPVGIPAVFLLVQHLESGYFERLAQQLQKSSQLPVKVATADVVAAPGQVLVIPASERVTLETDGRLAFASHASVPHYTPCIDDVLHDVADRFGDRATAIIFSGMAGDAVEGAVYLTGRGGQVWAQDPTSCVVSSMVDGARARGVVEFTGSPRELAQRCVTRFVR